MQTHSSTTRVSDLTSKVIEKIMMAMGFFAYLWILALLLAGLIDK